MVWEFEQGVDSLSLSLFLSLPHSLSLSHAHSLSLSLTHTHTLSLSLSHTPALRGGGDAIETPEAYSVEELYPGANELA